jgi:hypothetical protein
MAYPGDIDTFPTLVDGQPAFASYFNNIHAAVQAIEETLGTDPAASYDTVADALAALATRSVGPHPFLMMGA